MRRKNHIDPLRPAVEIGRENFNGRSCALTDRQDALPEVLGSSIDQVVACDRSDHNVSKTQAKACLGQPPRLVDRNCLGFSALHCAETARARARFAQDHERRRVPGPAL
jgi:hypothetical protein